MLDRVPDMAARRAALTPGRTAFIDHESGRRWSFAEVEDAAARLAAGLRAMGLEPGDRLAVLTLNRVEFFVALFACWRARLVMAPLNWRQPVPELSGVIGSVGASAVLYDADNRETARGLAAARGLRTISREADPDADADLPGLLDANEPMPAEYRESGDVWYLLFTSGTTGLPKAVIQTPRMAWASAVNTAQAIGLTGEDRTVNFLPLFHTAGINLYTLPLFMWGGPSTVLPRFAPDDILDLIRAGEVTQLFGLPAIYQAFSLHPRVDEAPWDTIRAACGGAPLPEPLIRFFAARGLRICNGFGMTETGPTAFLMDPERAEAKIGSVGRVQMLTEARIDGLADGKAGEGELLLRGPTITPGYYNNPEATEAAFEDGWLHTGDVARRDETGDHWIVDRIKDMYISGGENVYPAEVERVLNEHPDVLEAAVIGVPDARWGEVGAAFVLARPGRSVDAAAVVAWCRERLAAYKAPRSVTVMEEMPRTPSGKVRKPVLRAQAREARDGT